MGKDPAFLFYPKDFLTGVSDLTMEERGQYITLLCLQHQKGRLSEKMISINMPDAAADVLAKFRQDENGNFFNERLEAEIEKRAQHSEKQRQRALEGWKKRKKQKAAVKATANAAALPLGNVNGNVNKDVIKEGESVKGGVPEWMDFLQYALSHKPKINQSHLEMKYNAWKENGWKTGGKTPRKIKNWKTTLLNTLPHIAEETGSNKKSELTQQLEQRYGIN